MVKTTWILLVALCSWAQTPRDGFFQVGKVPWNGDYFAEIRDQMVHGEGYHGYPGPLPKFFHVLGWDNAHPSIETELRVFVNREAASWWGNCDGRSVAAIRYDEPEALVARGIKFLPGDLKALLTSLHKADVGSFSGVSDRQYGGLSAKSFESILFSKLADKGLPVIFDHDPGPEIWNFPVAQFSRESTINGPWTEVKATVWYSAIIPLNDATGITSLDPTDYFYRYKTTGRTDYQWTGGSTHNHPENAWVGKGPIRESWALKSNQLYNATHYRELLKLSQEPEHMHDRWEPNDLAAEAHPLGREFLLGSLPAEDRDFFRIDLVENETLDLLVAVYDGPPMSLLLSYQDGTTHLDIAELNERRISFKAPRRGCYYLQLKRPHGAYGDSFYKLVFDEDHGVFSPRPQLAGREVSLTAINTGNRTAQLAADRLHELAPFAAYRVEKAAEPSQLRTDNRTVFAEVLEQDGRFYKSYFLDHERQMPYVVPHLSFKNGWDTRLTLWSRNGDPVGVTIYDRFGNRLQRSRLPLDEHHGFSGSLKTVIDGQSRAQGAWFRLETEAGNRLRGHAVFIHGEARIPIQITGAPRFRNLKVFDLKPADRGSTGIALVNSSGMENYLLYRVEDRQGRILAEGEFTLNPGERWLGTAAQLAGDKLEEGALLTFHTFYAVEGLVIQYRAQPYEIYGHRILSEDLDRLTETVISKNQDANHLLLMNPESRPVHVLLEGYDAAGRLQGRFNLAGGRPLRYRETRRVSLRQILTGGVDLGDLEAITHFRITTKSPIYMLEGFQADGGPAPQMVHPPHLFDLP